MDWKIELIPVPASDHERARAFYADQLGFVVDLDHQITPEFRIIQLTPPGSGCSIMIGVSEMTPGSLQGIQIVVDDIAAARAEIVERGVDASPIWHMEDGEQVDGPGGPWNSFVTFSDPDGNGWVLQERPPAGTENVGPPQ
jgi:catechol 2,3-dioxygenase-like lactoylglutathione lyase family enzyme